MERPFATGVCAISNEWTYKGMDVVWLENDLIGFGVSWDGALFKHVWCKVDKLDKVLRLLRLYG